MLAVDLLRQSLGTLESFKFSSGPCPEEAGGLSNRSLFFDPEFPRPV